MSPAPVGLGRAPRHAPQRLRTRQDLAQLQRLMTHTLVQPLAPNDRLAPRWRDGRPIAKVVAEFIKPNDRLTAVERLEIYARCYWYRITDSLYEDCPGLRALLGERRFAALAKAYLTQYPSRSFTLRNLGSRLPQFIAEAPRWTAPDTKLALAIARFEWAQTHAFDAAALPPVTPQDLAKTPPHRLRLGLQPHLSLLAADWPVDDYVIAVKQRDSQRAEASNTPLAGRSATSFRRVRRPRMVRTYIVIHRYKGRLYYKRTTAAGFAILEALQRGRTLAQAITPAGTSIAPDQTRDMFSTWMELGWFCRREQSRSSRVRSAGNREYGKAGASHASATAG